ncbi:MAG: hypothetical protein NVS9B15_18160 [Acidobacteriaceae bacterium]
MLDLDGDIAAFASINAQLGYRPNPVVQLALRLLRAERESRPLPESPKLFDRTHIENAAEYAGTYTAPDSRTVVIAANADHLTWTENNRTIPIQTTFEGTMFLDDPAYNRFPLLFARESANPKAAVTELALGPDWLTNERYRGPRTFPMPKHWQAFTGNYIADSPWLGSTRVITRKGKLWLDGAGELIPVGANIFRPAQPDFSPERIEFFLIGDGKARAMRITGSNLYRAEVD